MNKSYTTPEIVLKYIVDNFEAEECIKMNVIIDHFSDQYKRSLVVSAFKELNKDNLIKLSISDDNEIGKLCLTSEGAFYFENQEDDSNFQCPTVNIYDSSGINVGNNNTVNINNGCDFEDLHNIINSLQVSNQETYHELINTLQDCIKNNKPIPKGKFSKAIEITQEIIPLFTAIGSLIFRYLA